MRSNSTAQNISAVPSPATASPSNIPTLVPMAVTIVLVNSFVIFLFVSKKKLRTPSNYLLFSLTLSDLVNGAINIPLFLCFESTQIPRPMRKMFILAYMIFSMLTTASTSYHILVITAEKYLAIVKPLRHRSSNPKNIFKWIAVVWFVSLAIALVQLASEDVAPISARLQFYMAYAGFCFVAIFLLPYMFIIYAQVVILRAIAQSAIKYNLLRGKASKSQWMLSIANEKKCLAIFAAMAVMFLVCWLPWFTLKFLITMSHAVPSLHGKINIPDEVLRMSIIIRFCTCIINPLLYTFFKRDFMVACRSLCYRCTPKRTTVSESTITKEKTSKDNYVAKRFPNNLLPPRTNIVDRVRYSASLCIATIEVLAVETSL